MTEDPETWKSINGYDGLYEVSSYGRIKSVSRLNRSRQRVFRDMILKSHNSKGYRHISLWKDGVQKDFSVHTLVLIAFMGPPLDRMEACHKDGKRDNNSIRNLRWGTRSSNANDRRLHGTMLLGEMHKMAKLTEDAVLEIRKMSSEGVSQRKMAVDFGVSNCAIHQVVTGKTWGHVA